MNETAVPSPQPEAPKKNNTTWIIVGVVFVLLCCCCLILAGLGWQYGDQILQQLGIY